MIDFLRSSKAHIFLDQLLETVCIAGEDYHHLSRVLRIKKEDIVSGASNSKVRKYEVVDIDKTQIQLKAVGDILENDENEIVMAVSLFKLDRLEWGIAKAVELGVSKIIIGTTKRSTIKLDEKSRLKLEARLTSIIRNSSMQSRRCVLAQIEIVGDLFGYLNEKRFNLVVCDPAGAVNVDVQGKVIVVGPEGGFENGEIDSLDLGAQLWSISPSVLRAETATAFATGLASRSFQKP